MGHMCTEMIQIWIEDVVIVAHLDMSTVSHDNVIPIKMVLRLLMTHTVSWFDWCWVCKWLVYVDPCLHVSSQVLILATQ